MKDGFKLVALTLISLFLGLILGIAYMQGNKI